MSKLTPGGPGLVTYEQDTKRHIRVFAVADEGDLYENHWDGVGWAWKPHGHPPGVPFAGPQTDLSAVTYVDNKRRTYCFGEMRNLFVGYDAGAGWQWKDQGNPIVGSPLGGPPSAITYAEGGVQRIRAFTQGTLDWSLRADYWDGMNWTWETHGLPSNVQGELVGGPTAISYTDSQDGKERIHAFMSSGPAAGAKGRLYRRSFDGNGWDWHEQGTPGTEPGALPSVISYEDTTRRIYAFVSNGAFNGNLFVNYCEGNACDVDGWKWADLGTLPGFQVDGPCQAVTYLEGNTQRIYVFVPCQGHLGICYWKGDKWRWADQGAPPAGWYERSLRAITFRQGGTQRMYAFFIGQDHHLWVHYWNGQKWDWADQGIP